MKLNSQREAFSAELLSKQRPWPSESRNLSFKSKMELFSTSRLFELIKFDKVFLVRPLCIAMATAFVCWTTVRTSRNRSYRSALVLQARVAVCLASYARRQLSSNSSLSLDRLRKTFVLIHALKQPHKLHAWSRAFTESGACIMVFQATLLALL